MSAFDALPRRASDLSMRKLRTRTPLGGLFSALIATILVTSTSEAAQQSAQDSDSSRPTIGAHAVDNGPGIDGVLDEPEWADAEVAGDFTQREPDPGEPASESTEFRVIYTRSTLYIGVIAYDRRPDQLIADEMQRDSMLENDDSVSILLDTFHDHRNGFLFETNANGARSDALVEAEGSQPNRQWDGVWRVRSTRTTEGWIAEIAIPLLDAALQRWERHLGLQHATSRAAPLGGNFLVADWSRGERDPGLARWTYHRPEQPAAGTEPARQAVRAWQ